MTHVRLRDNSNSTTKGQIITIPVTVIECPPLKPFSLRFYKNTSYGLKLSGEILAKDLDKELIRKITLSKKEVKGKELTEADELRLVVYTQPKLIGKKKKPEIFEVGISGDIEFGKSLLDKEIKAQDILEEGQLVDIHAVTKAKGFQGPVKRFGVRLRAKKSEKVTRGPGSLGPWNQQQHISYRVARAGQTGYHPRVDYNKLIIKIGSKVEEINPKGGFLRYGEVKNDYVLIKGSLPGPKKRLIRFTTPMRPKEKMKVTPEIIKISLASKQ